MNKKIKLLTTVAIASVGISSYTGMALAASGTGQASATVVQVLSITNSITDLAFGEVIATTSAETVIISPSGILSGSATPTGTTTAGVFTVDGKEAKTYAVTVPSVAVTLTSGSDTMNVVAFTFDGGGGVGNPGVVTNGGGPLNIGATLQVGASQAGGSYTGSYNITVDYN
jgi:hypothetical protein